MDIEKGKQILIEVRAVLDEFSIPFFLSYGTALGAIREGGFIPYDLDIDLGVLYENLRGKIDLLCSAFEQAGFEAYPKNWPFTESRAIVVFKDGIKTDIAGFMKNGNRRFSHSTFKQMALVYPAELIEKTTAIIMYGRKWNCLSEAFLIFNYGSKWMVPDQKWNVSLSPAFQMNYDTGGAYE